MRSLIILLVFITPAVAQTSWTSSTGLHTTVTCIGPQGETCADFNSKFYALASIILFVGFIILFGKGFESFVQSSRLFGGAAMMLTGWMMGLAAVVLFIFWFLGHD
jgi:hypothetical protein